MARVLQVRVLQHTFLAVERCNWGQVRLVSSRLLMLQPIDNSVGERILGHCCGVWREVALQHLTGNSITTDK